MPTNPFKVDKPKPSGPRYATGQERVDIVANRPAGTRHFQPAQESWGEYYDYLQGSQPDEPDYLDMLISQQQAEAAARQARIDESLATINRVFAGRDKVFDRYADTVYEKSEDKLAEGQDEAAQNLKFALARAGQTGGSVDVDKSAELEERTQEGRINARSYADRQAADLAAAEEQVKQALMGLATSGNVTGAQIRSTAAGLRAPTNRAIANPTAAPGLADVFAGLANNIGQAAALAGFRGFPFGGDENETSSFVAGSPKKRETGTVATIG